MVCCEKWIFYKYIRCCLYVDIWYNFCAARAKSLKTNEIVALKKVKFTNNNIIKEGFPVSALREVTILLEMKHPNIVNVKEVVVGSDMDKIFMVMEFVDHTVKDLQDQVQKRFNQAEVKCLMQQLLEGVKYMHENWIIHRDLKTSNLLLDNKGNLKICGTKIEQFGNHFLDFGLARRYGDPIRQYSPIVITQWYRPLELLLGATTYGPEVDLVRKCNI